MAKTPVTTAPVTTGKTPAEIKAGFQRVYDSFTKQQSGSRAAFTKRLQAMNVPAELMPVKAGKSGTASEYDSMILEALASLKG